MQQGNNSDEFIKALRKGVILIACRVCGQVIKSLDKKNVINFF